jgi:hypothetical protein
VAPVRSEAVPRGSQLRAEYLRVVRMEQSTKAKKEEQHA